MRSLLRLKYMYGLVVYRRNGPIVKGKKGGIYTTTSASKPHFPLAFILLDFPSLFMGVFFPFPAFPKCPPFPRANESVLSLVFCFALRPTLPPNPYFASRAFRDKAGLPSLPVLACLFEGLSVSASSIWTSKSSPSSRASFRSAYRHQISSSSKKSIGIHILTPLDSFNPLFQLLLPLLSFLQLLDLHLLSKLLPFPFFLLLLASFDTRGLVKQSLSYTLHMSVRFDHFGIEIRGPGERELVFRRKISSARCTM